MKQASQPVRFSILLPTLRRKLFEATLFAIYANSRGHSYEIIVVSPFKIEGESIKWIEEKKAGGCIRAFADAYAQSSGEIIVAMTDDTMPLPGWLDAIDTWIRRGEEKYMPYCIGLNRVNVTTLGTAFGKYYGYFPAISRKSIEAAGGMFYDPAFVGNWADPDLGMRVWAAGGRVEYCHDAHIFMVAIQALFAEAVHKAGRYFVQDSALFWKKWHHIAPDGYNGKYFRDINADYLIGMARDNTVLIDYPDKRAMVDDMQPLAGLPEKKITSYLGGPEDVMGYDFFRIGYEDMTTEVQITPHFTLRPYVGSFTKTFPTVVEAVEWVAGSLNLPVIETCEPGTVVRKLGLERNQPQCLKLVSMGINGINCALPVWRLTYFDNFFGTEIVEFVVNGTSLFAASTRVDLTKACIGFLLLTRMDNIFVSPSPDEVMRAFLHDATFSGRIAFPWRRIVVIEPIIRLVILATKLLRLYRRLTNSQKGKLIRTLRKTVWSVILGSMNGATLYRREIRRLYIPELKI